MSGRVLDLWTMFLLGFGLACLGMAGWLQWWTGKQYPDDIEEVEEEPHWADVELFD